MTATTERPSTSSHEAAATLTLDALVERSVQLRPDAVALRHDGESISYAQLWALSGAWAAALTARGVVAGDLVGVCLPRTPLLVAALVAVHRLGAAYVPLDPDYPVARIAHIASDSGLRVVMADRTTADVLGEVDRVLADELDEHPVAVDAVSHSPNDLAYVIYTSGSTGLPKGVAIEHRHAAGLVAWARDVYDDDELSGVLFSTSICFDLSVFELFATLAHGGTVILADNALALPTLPDVDHVRLVNTVPSAIGVLARAGEIPATVRTVNLAGEPLTRAVTDLVHAAGVERVYNLYGPSEDTTYSTWTLVPRGLDDEPTIGVPLPGTRAYVLDDARRPVPDGEIGELYLAGPKVARGYLGRPDLTDERFLPDPEHPGERMYRTGDLVERLGDGELRYRGRTDHQVKVRGFRVELGEIEATLVRHPDVTLACVVVRPDPLGAASLVAFVESVATGDDAETLVGDLRRRCADRLPPYMVPTAIGVLPAMPLTPNGKVDRAALPEIEIADVEGEGATTDVEQLVAGIWAEVLGLPAPPPVDVAFAALGGHSLLAAAALHRIARATGRRLPMAKIGVAATVRDVVVALDRTPVGDVSAPVRGHADAGRRYRATPSQIEFYVLEEMGDESSAVAVMPLLVRTDQRVDIAVLRRALDLLPVRHAALRTVIDNDADGPVAIVGEAAPVPLVEVGDEPALHDLRAHPISLRAGRLLEAAVVADRGTTDTILLRVHHAAFDGWSIGLLVRDLAEVYDAVADGREPAPGPQLQLADGADWLAGERDRTRDAALAYWERRLDGRPGHAVIPATRPGAAARRRARDGDMATLPLPASLQEDLEAFTREHEVTAYSCILAATALRIQRETGVGDMVFQVPVSNRRHPDLEDVIGPFMETAPARVDVTGNPTFAELARRISALTAQDLDLSWVDSSLMFAPLGQRRGAGGEPIGGTLVAVQNYRKGAHTAGGRTWVVDAELSNGAAKLDLSFFWELTHATGAQLQVEYDTGLHTAEGAQGSADQVLRILHAGLSTPERPVDEIAWAAQEDLDAYAHLNARTPVVATTTAPETIAALAATDPGRAAVVAPDGTLVERGALHDAALAGAAEILRLTGGPGPQPVAVAARRGAPGIAGMLAAWYAGRPYLPLDTTHPAARLADILDDSGAVVLMHDDTCPAVVTAPPRLPVPVPGVAVAPDTEPVPVAPDDLAYVIYTSGSTGRPKGVEIEHGALAAFLTGIGEVVPIGADDVVTYLTTPSFDIAGLELWLTLTSGGRVAVVDEETTRDGFALARRIAEVGATLVQATPSGWQLLLDAGPTLRGVRALVGAEPVPPRLAGQLLQRAAGVWNVYGPTEATIWSCALRVREQDTHASTLPIGAPLPNTAVHVLDHAGQVAPVGTVGAIHLAGTSLARGYHGRPDLTEAAFRVADHLPGSPRIYRTGDLGTLRPDGLLECLGRADNQVKVRGVRIELEEVDEAIRALPGILRATSRVQPDGPAAGQLVGYVVTATDPDVPAMRSQLAQRLPGAMVPTLWVRLDDLPLNAAGKIDRRALPSPQAGDDPDDGEPLGELEEFLAEIWQAHLPVTRIGRHGDFFELGGHSLTATRVVAQARAELELDIPVRVLFQHSTLAGFAVAVEELLAVESR